MSFRIVASAAGSGSCSPVLARTARRTVKRVHMRGRSVSSAVISQKFADFNSDRTCDRRWVSVKGKTPVRPGTDQPVEWRKTENRYTWEKIQMIPGEYGIILDKTGLACVDFDKCLVDGRIADDRIASIVQRLDSWTEVSSSGTGLHTWVVTDANTPNLKPGTGYELITDGHVKITGRSYEPAMHYPIRMVNGKELKEILGLDGVTPTRAPGVRSHQDPMIPEGQRNDTLFRMAARLRHDGMSEAGIRGALMEENRARCVPPLPVDEVFTIAGSAGSYPPGTPITQIPGVSVGALLTPEIEELISNYHHNTAIAKSLNKTIGTEAGDGDRVRYCTTEKLWYVWDGKRWVRDDRNEVLRLAWNHVCDLMVEASQMRNKVVQLALIKSQSDNEVTSALTLLISLVSITANDFDKDHALLNCLNGTIDLRTQKLLPFNKKDLVTKMAPVEYIPGAGCPKWLAHLSLVFGNDADLIAAYQRVMGYTLIGGNGENKFFILFGRGKNGKSVVVNTTGRVLGDYCMNADASTFYSREHMEAPRPDIARMKGCRMVTAAEGKAGKYLDEGVIKNLTGGDPVTARYLFGREFDFMPTAKLFLHTNHLPRINDRDDGIWRRPYPIPFNAVIPENARITNYDKVLASDEGPGILNWMLAGLADYIKEKKLLYPKKVLEALDQYKATTDILAEFLEGYVITRNDNDVVLRSDLWNSYKLWVGTEKAFTKTRFNAMIEERIGIAPKRTAAGIVWIGIKIQGQSYLDRGTVPA